jgi:hypothetical protein
MFFQQRRQRRLLIRRRWLWLAAVSVSVLLILAGGWILVGRPASNSRLETWTAQPVADLTAAIGPDDELWDEAVPLNLALHTGSHGPLTAKSVELRALYDESMIAFRARWPGTATAEIGERFALVWHKDDLPNQRGQDCTTACHVAQSSSHGDIQAVVPSFVPAGREEPLPTQAVWREGMWTVTWLRPLRSSEARDIQFVDLGQRYRVRAKVFLELSQKPDLLTEDTYLAFARHKQ